MPVHQLIYSSVKIKSEIFFPEQQAEEIGAGKTFIILFAMSMIIIILQGVGLFILYKKRREVVLR